MPLTLIYRICKELKIRFFLILLFLIFQPILAIGFIKVTPDEVKNLPVKTNVQVQGVAVVEPGILGSQIFYLNGVQIYSYYKDFPELKIGDEILVKGEISQSRGEKRVKIKTKEDILLLNKGVVIEPRFLVIDTISGEFVGDLIKIKGLVIEKTGQEIFINDDAGEITVYIKEYVDIDKSVVKEGDNVEITGILTKNNDEFRLLPRGNKDIAVVKALKEEKEVKQIHLLASEAGVIDFYQLKPYFIISAIILGLIFIILLFFEKRRNG
ncbi:MAG: DUF5689 domain-containing protein [Patescibacteria group bacterium]|jgi:DNA/RNA endonuclease YhcR with UshA esterase domain|nr:DUF5689 domain-containing protein [Patescibacteria group bacterium]MDD5173036.1 DUF5689 domain-containing protein [Patescibacteria group bacterium]